MLSCDFWHSNKFIVNISYLHTMRATDSAILQLLVEFFICTILLILLNLRRTGYCLLWCVKTRSINYTTRRAGWRKSCVVCAERYRTYLDWCFYRVHITMSKPNAYVCYGALYKYPWLLISNMGIWFHYISSCMLWHIVRLPLNVGCHSCDAVSDIAVHQCRAIAKIGIAWDGCVGLVSSLTLVY